MQPEERLPVLRSIFRREALVTLLEREYGLHVLRLQLIKSVVLDTYRIQTDAGAYAFRIYPANRRTREAISAELDFVDFLHAHSIPVSTPVPAEDGRRMLTLQAPEGARHAALFTFAPGRPPREGPGIARLFGSTLGRLHQVADNFPKTQAREPLDLRYLLVHPLAQLDSVVHRREDWANLREIAAEVAALLRALPVTAPWFGYCHGDVCRANAHVSDTGDLMLFDFDFCGPGWRAYDVATFLSGEPAAVTTEFLEGYSAVRPLGDQETRAIPLFQIAQRIWMLGTRASYLDEWGLIHMTEPFIERVLGEIRTAWKTYARGGA